MLIVMKNDASDQEIADVMQRIREMGFTPHRMPGAQRTAIAITGNPGAIDPGHFSRFTGIAEAVPISKPFKLVARETKQEDTVIRLPTPAGHAQIGGGHFGVIAGPCAVEGRDQLMGTAQAVREGGAHFLRGGAFKPRTSPYSFQGLKEEGLKLLAEARAATGMPIVTEVMDTQTVELVAEYADMLQIGARNMQNFSLLEAVGQVRKPVMLKRGLSATIQEFLMSAEYIIKGGNYQVVLCERGIRTFETMTRNTLDLGSIPLIKRLTHLPVIVDPSHGTGDWRLVPALARAAVAVGADGLMVEVHPEPAKALSDGPQSLTPTKFLEMMQSVRAVAQAVGMQL
ncbi:MAG TPA: 3-deoxy-7-phosphoheptulonate synthase [Polyangia bacterium]|nr:3-deoxy-7-phosphoheptulonate synthase [Polyangia bacterium]